MGRSVKPATAANEVALPDLADLVRAQATQLASQSAHIATLIGALESQRLLYDRMLAIQAAAAPPSPPANDPPAPAEAVDTLTIAEFWIRYADTLAGKRWLPSVSSMMKKVLVHLAPSLSFELRGRARRGWRPIAGPDMLAAALRPFHWSDFRDQLKRREPGIKVGTRNLMLRRLKALYNWGTGEGRVKQNPLQRTKIETPRPKRETTISDEDIERFRSPIVRAYILTLVDSGMRPGEARILRRDQFDLDTGRTLLSWTTTKGQKSRPAWVTPRVLAAYEAVPARKGNPYIFASPRGKAPYSECRLWQFFAAERARLGLIAAPGDGAVHPHDGRRSFASRLNRKDVAINKIQVLLGHSDIKTTEGYLSVNESDLLAAHLRLDASLRRPPQSKKPTPPDED